MSARRDVYGDDIAPYPKSDQGATKPATDRPSAEQVEAAARAIYAGMGPHPAITWEDYKLEAEAALTAALALPPSPAQISAAKAEEREAIARWYDDVGWRLDEDDVSRGIRARAAERASATASQPGTNLPMPPYHYQTPEDQSGSTLAQPGASPEVPGQPSPDIARRAAEIAGTLRGLNAGKPELDIIGLRGKTVEAIGVARLDDLLEILDCASVIFAEPDADTIKWAEGEIASALEWERTSGPLNVADREALADDQIDAHPVLGKTCGNAPPADQAQADALRAYAGALYNENARLREENAALRDPAPGAKDARIRELEAEVERAEDKWCRYFDADLRSARSVAADFVIRAQAAEAALATVQEAAEKVIWNVLGDLTWDGQPRMPIDWSAEDLNHNVACLRELAKALAATEPAGNGEARS